MSFIRRVVDHLLNQVLVEGLANSRWFQRFAVWSHSKMQDLNSTAKDPNAALDSTLKAAQATKEGWAKWRQDVLEEMRRLQQQRPGTKQASEKRDDGSHGAGGV